MKQINVTDTVMKQVVRFEKRRIRRWTIAWWTGCFFVLAAFIGVSVVFWQTTAERGTWDLLEIFSQDREIIAQFLGDTLWTMWEEIPRRPLVIAAALGVFVIFMVVITKRRRRILAQKRAELAKFGHVR
jgi:H+/Cl- antiporter ClcA